MYRDFVSDEPLAVIRANECENDIGSLATKRYRALWNAIEALLHSACCTFDNCAECLPGDKIIKELHRERKAE
jgi:hypothetical protein